MPYRALKALAGLILCAMLACTQQAAADSDNVWADCQSAEEESLAKHVSHESKRMDPDEPALAQAFIPTTSQHPAALTAAIGPSGPATTTQATSIRGPPGGRNISV